MDLDGEGDGVGVVGISLVRGEESTAQCRIVTTIHQSSIPLTRRPEDLQVGHFSRTLPGIRANIPSHQWRI